MEAVKYLNYTTEEFILDKEFSLWVLSPNKKKELFWESFLTEYPEKRAQISDAALILRSLQPTESRIPEQRLNDIFRKVNGLAKPKKRTIFRILKYAAVITTLIGVGSLIWLSAQMKTNFPIQAENASVSNGRIILANGLTREFDTEQTIIKQTTSGNLTINNDTINDNLAEKSSALNQIIIPYGKRSDITLADGTHIWLNSGSQLMYPDEFGSDSREVYLSGEALFEVKTNPNKPFYVITRDIRIKVLGTIFNVSSYAEDNTIQTVLLKGKISAGKNTLFGKTIDLVPGERLTYEKTNEKLLKDKVDVILYTSWVNGYLIFDNLPITEIYKKLERFYNRKIIVDEGLDQITFSGKLDMKSQIRDVIDNISFASSVKVFENNETYIIKK